MGLHLENTLGCTHPTVPLFPSQQCVCERERDRKTECVCVFPVTCTSACLGAKNCVTEAALKNHRVQNDSDCLCGTQPSHQWL